MSTLKLENIKHMNSTVNNISVDSDGSTYFDSDLMTIDATNNYVGVGTLSPAAKLHVSGGSNNQFKVSSTGAEANLTLDGGSYAQINNTTGALYVTNNNATDIYFRTASTTRMTVDGSGRVTMPYQPSFVAYGSANAYSTFSAPSKLTGIDSTFLNVGGHYNTSTQRFVAPIDGVYFFHYVTISQTSSAGSLTFNVNGSAVSARSYRENERNVQLSAIVECNANDYVEIFVQDGSQTLYNGSAYSRFYGYLLG